MKADTLLCVVGSLVYGLFLLLQIDLRIVAFCLKINALIGLAFLSLTLANFISQNKVPKYHSS